MHWTREALALRLLQVSDLDVTRRNMPKENILLMIQNVSRCNTFLRLGAESLLMLTRFSNSGDEG